MILTKKVVFIAKDDGVEKMKELLTMMVEPSRAEDGCLLYEIYQVKDNLKKFVVVESWRDEKALDGHKASAHYKEYKTTYEPYCEDKYSEELEALVD